jgi:hypothetical protein
MTGILIRNIQQRFGRHGRRPCKVRSKGKLTATRIWMKPEVVFLRTFRKTMVLSTYFCTVRTEVSLQNWENIK